MKLIPLWAKDGSVRGQAVVDDSDYAALDSHRWYMTGRYAVRTVGTRPDQHMIYMHREIAGLEHSRGWHGSGPEVDHRNTDTLDNRRANLRVVDRLRNNQNRSPKAWRGLSPYRGVSWNKSHQKWQAQVTIEYRLHHLGYFDVELDAAQKAQAFRDEHMPYASTDPLLVPAEVPQRPIEADDARV